MDYEKAEDILVNMLKPLTVGGNVDVMPMPEAEEDLKFAFQKPQVWVVFNDTEFTPEKSASTAVQNTTVNFEVMIQSRFRRGPKGCYSVMKAIALLLIGKQPKEFKSLIYLTDERLVRYDDRGNWCYRQQYSTKDVSIPTDDGSLDTVLQGITAQVVATTGIGTPQ